MLYLCQDVYLRSNMLPESNETTVKKQLAFLLKKPYFQTLESIVVLIFENLKALAKGNML